MSFAMKTGSKVISVTGGSVKRSEGWEQEKVRRGSRIVLVVCVYSPYLDVLQTSAAAEVEAAGRSTTTRLNKCSTHIPVSPQRSQIAKSQSNFASHTPLQSQQDSCNVGRF